MWRRFRHLICRPLLCIGKALITDYRAVVGNTRRYVVESDRTLRSKRTITDSASGYCNPQRFDGNRDSSCASMVGPNLCNGRCRRHPYLRGQLRGFSTPASSLDEGSGFDVLGLPFVGNRRPACQSLAAQTVAVPYRPSFGRGWRFLVGKPSASCGGFDQGRGR